MAAKTPYDYVIPFFIEQPKPSWELSTQHYEEYGLNEVVQTSWWYDCIVTMSNYDFQYLFEEFKKLDKDISRSIDVAELQEIKIMKKRLPRKPEQMAVLQPEINKILTRLDLLPKEEQEKYNKVVKAYTKEKQDKPLTLKGETCKEFVAAFSSDENEKTLSLFEYLGMMQYIQLCVSLYQLFDEDDNNNLDADELLKIFDFFGYTFTKEQAQIIKKKMGWGLIRKIIELDEFIPICSKLALARTQYQRTVLKGSKLPFDGKLFAGYFMEKFMN